MPLIVGKSKQTLAKNIAELHKANADKPEDKKRPDKQIIAIAFSQKRKAEAKHE